MLVEIAFLINCTSMDLFCHCDSKYGVCTMRFFLHFQSKRDWEVAAFFQGSEVLQSLFLGCFPKLSLGIHNSNIYLYTKLFTDKNFLELSFFHLVLSTKNSTKNV